MSWGFPYTAGEANAFQMTGYRKTKGSLNHHYHLANNKDDHVNVTNLLSLSPSTKKMPSSGFFVAVWRLTTTMLPDLLLSPLTTATIFLTQFLTRYLHVRTITNYRTARQLRRTTYWWDLAVPTVVERDIVVTRYIHRGW